MIRSIGSSDLPDELCRDPPPCVPFSNKEVEEDLAGEPRSMGEWGRDPGGVNVEVNTDEAIEVVNRRDEGTSPSEGVDGRSSIRATDCLVFEIRRADAATGSSAIDSDVRGLLG
jgi:hypothetical protein